MRVTKGVIILFLLALGSICIAQIKGKVVAIADGDSFTLLTDDNKQLKIRLHGIDCPEKNAPFGTQAKDFTSKLIFGKTISVKKTATDRYGRIIAIVYTPDGRVLNEEILKAGMAWHYKKHDKAPAWSKMEQIARKNKLGLWILPDPTPPWDYRTKNRRNKQIRKVRQATY